MSYTTMHVIDLDAKEIIDSIEYRNSHGSAPYVWDAMSKFYLHWDFWGAKDAQPLWDLFDKKYIKKSQRAVLGMTFDRAIIKREHFKEAADDIISFLSNFPPDPEDVNHWPSIVTRLMQLESTAQGNIAIGFHMTSVSENPLVKWDDDAEEGKLVETLWDVYDELGKQSQSLKPES
jgi:hypothetical protein